MSEIVHPSGIIEVVTETGQRGTIGAPPGPTMTCVVCGAIGFEPVFIGWKTPGGWWRSTPTCRHGDYYHCPEHTEDTEHGCPQCGCQEVYT